MILENEAVSMTANQRTDKQNNHALYVNFLSSIFFLLVVVVVGGNGGYSLGMVVIREHGSGSEAQLLRWILPSYVYIHLNCSSATI